jgi:hypothetical protein
VNELGRQREAMEDRRDLGPRAGGRENWSSLSNLHVSGEDGPSASAAAGGAAISGFAGGAAAAAAAVAASARPPRVNKTSLSFILDEQTVFLSSTDAVEE